MATDTKKEEKEIVVKDVFDNVPILSDEDVADFASTGNMGDNDFEQNDITYGWLKFTQTNSQVATKGHQKYIKGMEAGCFYDTLTNTNLGPSVKLIYLKSFRSYTEYEGAKGEGKFVRSIQRDEFKRLVDAKKIVQVEGEGLKIPEMPTHYVAENMNYMVMVQDRLELGILRFSVGMGSIRQCKVWNTLLDTAFLPDGRAAPKWAYAWKLTLSLDTDKKNHSYWNFGTGNKANIERQDLVRQPLRSRVIKNFIFFQKTSVETVDKAGESAYHDDEFGGETYEDAV